MNNQYTMLSVFAALFLSLLVSGIARADNFDVTVANDPGDGSVANTLSWAINQANANPGGDTITLGTDVLLTGSMRVLIDSDMQLHSDAARRAIDGDGSYRPLFIRSGVVAIENLDIVNGRAKGGDSNRGGGGAGLGGAVFVLDGDVTMMNVGLFNNAAVGGAGGSSGIGAGGGMAGNGFGDGGGGLFDDSAGVNADGAGANGGNAGEFGPGADGDFGGGGGSSAFAFGGDGGFGAGGGSGLVGGNGGFGGGGGAGDLAPDTEAMAGIGGNGGFGGGGGFGAFHSGAGGFGGGSSIGGGGGAGFGGAIFAVNGKIDLFEVQFAGNSTQAGRNGNPEALADDVFVCTAAIDPSAALCGAVVNADEFSNPGDVFGVIGSISSDTIFADGFEG